MIRRPRAGDISGIAEVWNPVIRDGVIAVTVPRPACQDGPRPRLRVAAGR